MYLTHLDLWNFKNYSEAHFDFSSGINCIVGANGSGKTNLLDAVYYLSMTKSAFSSTEIQNIRHGENWMMIAGNLEKNQKNIRLTASYYLEQKRKTFAIDKKEYEKISEHIGFLPSVMISPDDIALIQEGSEFRRKFFDGMISQLEKKYLQLLITYQHALQARNAILKQLNEKASKFEVTLLEPYDVLLKEYSVRIGRFRQQFLQEYVSLLQKHYEAIAASTEHISLQYQTDSLANDFNEKFDAALPRDILLQRTTVGIHKDDFLFEMNQYPLKKYGSQGQQKSYLIALKLAQFEISYQKIGVKPLLLLDDIFDKLDDKRIAHLLALLYQQPLGQVFITDARPERSRQLFSAYSSDLRWIEVEKQTGS